MTLKQMIIAVDEGVDADIFALSTYGVTATGDFEMLDYAIKNAPKHVVNQICYYYENKELKSKQIRKILGEILND